MPHDNTRGNETAMSIPAPSSHDSVESSAAAGGSTPALERRVPRRKPVGPANRQRSIRELRGPARPERQPRDRADDRRRQPLTPAIVSVISTCAQAISSTPKPPPGAVRLRLGRSAGRHAQGARASVGPGQVDRVELDAQIRWVDWRARDRGGHHRPAPRAGTDVESARDDTAVQRAVGQGSPGRRPGSGRLNQESCWSCGCLLQLGGRSRGLGEALTAPSRPVESRASARIGRGFGTEWGWRFRCWAR